MAVKIYPKGSTEQLSKNFRAYEFDCRCGRCTETKIDTDLVEILQKSRDHFDKPVHINSGYRCEYHNANVGGAAGSLHTKGMAADTWVEGEKPSAVAMFMESIGVLGIGLYETTKDGHFVHADSRKTKSFWYGQVQAYRSTFGGAPKAEKAPVETVSVKLPVLSKGDKGESVKALQLLLIGNGYSCGKAGADGDFGSGTDSALRKYQKAEALTVDGKAGTEVWESLLGV